MYLYRKKINYILVYLILKPKLDYNNNIIIVFFFIFHQNLIRYNRISTKVPAKRFKYRTFYFHYFIEKYFSRIFYIIYIYKKTEILK